MVQGLVNERLERQQWQWQWQRGLGDWLEPTGALKAGGPAAEVDQDHSLKRIG